MLFRSRTGKARYGVRFAARFRAAYPEFYLVAGMVRRSRYLAGDATFRNVYDGCDSRLLFLPAD